MPAGWRDPGRVADYLSREIPHRDIAEAMLLQALPDSIERFIDLGTGNGRLIALVRQQHPDARALGVDFSGPMLAQAGERFAGDPLVELQSHDLAVPLEAQVPVDAVISALAIHHLEDARRQALFSEVYVLLRPGGVFVNLDLVAAVNAKQHERFRLAIGRLHDDPDDLLAGLCEQLDGCARPGSTTPTASSSGSSSRSTSARKANEPAEKQMSDHGSTHHAKVV